MFRKLSGIILIIVIVLTGINILAAREDPLSESVLRLHVIAHSDDPDDQILKMAVKDEIVKTLNSEFRDIEEVEKARVLAEKNILQIKETAAGVIKEQGYDYPVEVYIGECEFPTKSYGNMVFPQGQYQAVRVVIGEGQGKNWWCVLFPPLCVVSSSDKGLSMDSPEEAQVSFKCLELLPKGAKFSLRNN
jgi:stage II sporulation protein R